MVAPLHRPRAALARASSAAALLALAVAACRSEPTEPAEPLLGVYTLDAADDQALPYRFDPVNSFLREELAGGETEFHSRSRARDRKVIVTYTSAGQPSARTDSATVRYRLSGNTLVLEFPELVGRPAYADTGIVSDDRLRFILRARFPQGAEYIRVPLHYTRQP